MEKLTNRGIKYTVDKEGKTLTLELDLNTPGVISRSGKNVVLVTSKGETLVPGTDDLILGLNLYRKL